MVNKWLLIVASLVIISSFTNGQFGFPSKKNFPTPVVASGIADRCFCEVRYFFY